jgi:hypothetical protein
MAGAAITTTTALVCPHGGTVTIVSGNTRAAAVSGQLALSTDTFTIVGCPFQIPAVVPIPSPCVRVQWVLPDLMDAAGAGFTLSATSVGVCLSPAQLPQGKVQLAANQAAISSS